MSAESRSSESLFDTKFTNSDPSSGILPTDDINTTLINYRVLVSTREAGILIGKDGHVVASIRDDTGVKAGVSKLVAGSSERILTVSGSIDAVSHGLGLFAKALIDAPPASVTITFNYFPLKQLCPPNEKGETCLRILIPHSQMGTVIGKEGARIKAIQEQYHVKMIASKNFLLNSNERIVEIQGTPENITDALKVISKCLIEDFHSAAGTSYYVPTARTNTRTSTNGGVIGSSQSNGAQVSTTLSFPNNIVGALIGKNGSRIQGVRKVSGAIISISNDDENTGERTFTISGHSGAVERAKSMLYQNLEREQQRRLEAAEQV